MKDMNVKELTLLGKDLTKAKAVVLYKHGFSCLEIATILNVPESFIRKQISMLENDNVN